MKNKKLHLISNDGIIVEAQYEEARVSELIDKMLDSGEDENDENDDIIEIPLLNVSGESLKVIVDFLKYYHKTKMNVIPRPIPSVSVGDFISNEWYVNFIDRMNNKEIFEIILAANYMAIQPIIDLGCAKIASLIKGKTPEEVKELLSNS